MAKSVNPGQLRTLVRFVRIDRVTDGDGVPTESEVDVFGEVVLGEWKNAHGAEVFRNLELQLREPATFMCRYSPLITPKLIVYKVGDDTPYEVINVDNVDDRRRWLEVSLQRRVSAR
jgi:hypothetical protein